MEWPCGWLVDEARLHHWTRVTCVIWGAGVRVCGERGRVCLEEDTDRQTGETIPDLELQQNRTELLFRAGGIGIIRYSQVHRFILRQKTALRAVVVR